MRRSFVVIAACVLTLALPVGASAETTAAIKVKPHAVLHADGSATVTVSVRCTLSPGDTVQGGLVIVSQPEGFGGGEIVPTCGEKQERLVVDVTTALGGGQFVPGTASVTAFIAIFNPETGLTDAQDDTTVKLHES